MAAATAHLRPAPDALRFAAPCAFQSLRVSSALSSGPPQEFRAWGNAKGVKATEWAEFEAQWRRYCDALMGVADSPAAASGDIKVRYMKNVAIMAMNQEIYEEHGNHDNESCDI